MSGHRKNMQNNLFEKLKHFYSLIFYFNRKRNLTIIFCSNRHDVL